MIYKNSRETLLRLQRAGKLEIEKIPVKNFLGTYTITRYIIKGVLGLKLLGAYHFLSKHTAETIKREV